MAACPHCGKEVVIRELPHQGIFQSYRACSHCAGMFTVDRDSKYRQALFIIVALISCAFSILLYVDDSWRTPTVASYVALALLIWWGNRKVYFVRYNGRGDRH